MTIIEREIERREALLVEKDTKEREILELEARLDELRRDVENVDDGVLREEIEELKAYLPPDPEAEGVIP